MAYVIKIQTIGNELVNKLIQEGSWINISDFANTKCQRQIITTHYFVSNGSGIEEFDEILLKAVDDGKDLNITSIFRPPRVYFSYEVKQISQELELKWNEVQQKIPSEDLEFYLLDFDPIFAIYKYASENGFGILSYVYHEDDTSRTS